MVKKILISSILLSTVLANSAFAVTGKVTGNTVRIREKADSKAPEVSVATKNETVDVIGEEGNWYKVNFEDVTGYISKDYVQTSYSSNSNSQESSSSSKEQNTVSNQIEAPTESNTNKNSNSSASKNEVSNLIDNTNSVDTPKNETSISNENTNSVETSKNEVSNSIDNTNLEDNSSNNVQNYEQNENQETQVNIPDYEENQTVKFEQNADLKYIPSFTSRVSHKASSGEEYTVISVLNNWVKVQNENKSGWVLKTNITKKTETSENTSTSDEKQTSEQSNDSDSSDSNSKETKKGTVNVDSAVIREEPNGTALTSIKRGTEVKILGEKNDWYNISVGEFDSCYIAKRLITEK